MKVAGKTNYSPVWQMNHRLPQARREDSPTIELRQTGALQQNPIAFIDEDERSPSKSQKFDLDFNDHQRVTQLPRPTPERANENENLEEVYLCSCCGVTRELDPSIKYMSTFKHLFFVFNFLVFAFGLANLGMGLWFRIDPKVYEIHKYIETQNFTIAGWMMLASGFAACLMSLIGFSAANQQLAGQLVCYFTSMIILTLAFVGCLVLLTVYGLGVPLERFITKEIYEQIRRRSMNSETDLFMSSDAVQFLDFVQVKMRCCGATDFRDYGKLGMIVPTTCYTIDKNYVNAHGCGRAIRELFDVRAGLAAGFSSASVVVQLVTIILSALMFCSIYHWRANPRPATPAQVTANMTTHQTMHPKSLYNQAPRSRTPIMI